MVQTLLQRRKHYEPDPGRRVTLTPRAFFILERIYRRRFLTTAHILALIAAQGGSVQRARRLLRALMDDEYIMRIKDPRPRQQNMGSWPMIHGLTNKGADALAGADLVPRDHVNWTRRNAEVSDPRTGVGIKVVPHTLLISSVLTDIQCCVLNSKGAVRLIEAAELLATLAPETTRKSRTPFTWQVTVPYPILRLQEGEEALELETRRIGVTPDAVFGLEFAHLPEGRQRLFFFIEADLGGEAIVRSDTHFDQRAYYKKLVAYSATFVQGIHTARFGLGMFQVLTVTTSQERVGNMVQAFQHLKTEVLPHWDIADRAKVLKSLPRVFQFTARATAVPEALLRYAWHDGDGKLREHPTTKLAGTV